ncbi:unnamed protein product [Rhizophagus irregularis]|uniref:Uncharacterized protein n=1 Tax=Rhizophagus irregularis TaxID=588596 RepID=A0A2I1EIC5_9GLOM|nr:hypothetical protein RhiirB3_435621 [Rhizophagus irregularis]CAB5372052.1 unnamed protein product [Rhizophagus irregularis]
MVKTKELSNFECRRIIGLYETENLERTILRKTGYRKITIHNIITKYHKTAEKMQKEFIESTGKEVSKSTVNHNCGTLKKPFISELN